MHYGRLMLDVAGLTLTALEREQLQRDQVGGLILFSRNYRSRAQLIDLIAEIRMLNTRLVIAVDQEGGRVQRFKESFVRLTAMSALCLSYSKDPDLALAQATQMGWLMASELTSIDIDISFAPVLDLSWSHSKFIGDRSFGNRDQVSALAQRFMQGMREAGMAATGKHFPGHGWATADSHLEIAIDNRDFAALERDDLQPFRSLIDTDLAAIMPAHVIYPEMDQHPAGFSSYWLKSVLRQQLGFSGVIFSDDLNMSGAQVNPQQGVDQYAARAMAAIEAGCDTVLVCNNPQGATQVLDYLETEKIEKSQRLVTMRHQSVSIDAQRMEQAALIASQLCFLKA